MAGSIFNNINPGITSGTQLATLLNAFRDAMTSNSKGTSRPTNLLPGGVWVDDTNEGSPNFTVDVKLYDGSDDIKLMTINVNTNTVFIDSLASEEFEIVKVSDDAVGPQLILQKKRIAGSGQVLSNDILGLLNFKSIDNSGNVISEAASIEVSAQENHTNTNQGTRVKVNVRKAGQNTKTTQVTIDDEVTVAPRTTFQSVVNFQNGAEGTPLRGAVVAGTDILTPGTVSSVDISSLFSGKSESTSSTVKGVPTSSPYNKVMIRHALGTNQDDELKDSLGNQVYGRITKAGPVWTLSFYTKVGTTETAYTLTSGQSTNGIRWYYQELFNPLLDLPVYDPIFQVPSDNATADVVDASATQAGKVNTGSQTFAGEKTFENAMVFKQLGSAPTNPPSDYYKLYPKVDGFYYLDEAGLEKKVGSGGASGVNFVNNGNAEDAATTIFSTYKLAESVTFTDAGDLVTLSAHGLTGSSQISFTSITSTTGISTNTLYWPVAITANTFQVSLTQGGSPIALTTNGSGTMARSRPVTGTGGSPTNVSSSLSTSAPLAGAKEYTLFKAAANAMGEGWSIPLNTVSPAYRAKVLQIDFDYMVDSGTFVAGSSTADSDVIIYLYDITNSRIIEPSSIKLLASSTTVSDKFRASFQTDISASQYRLIFHVATPSTSAFQLKVDNISVSPTSYVFGTPITDWQPYSPTITGAGTPTSVDFKWRRVGDSAEVIGSFITGTVSGSSATFTLPFIADTNKIPGYAHFGDAIRINATGSTRKRFKLLVSGGSDVVSYVSDDYTTAAGPASSITGTSAWANTEVQKIVMTGIPIAGRSSSVQMSDQSDTRVVAVNGNYQTATGTAGGGILVMTKDRDTHDCWNNSTGVYTVKVAGWYRARAGSNIAASYSASQYAALQIRRSTAAIKYNYTIAERTASYSIMVQVDHTFWCDVGQTIDFYSFSNGTSPTHSAALGGADFSIERVSGPDQIAANELVLGVASGNPASASSGNPFIFPTIVTNTHGAYNSTTGRFTCPISGNYEILMNYAATGGANATLYGYKNGSIYGHIGVYHAAHIGGYVGMVIPCIAGDIIDVRANNTIDISDGQISFKRIGF